MWEKREEQDWEIPWHKVYDTNTQCVSLRRAGGIWLQSAASSEECKRAAVGQWAGGNQIVASQVWVQSASVRSVHTIKALSAALTPTSCCVSISPNTTKVKVGKSVAKYCHGQNKLLRYLIYCKLHNYLITD